VGLLEELSDRAIRHCAQTMEARRGFRLAAWVSLMVAASVFGCGDGDGSSTGIPADAPDREQVAATVNAMFEAWNAGDGEAACALMTDRGQRLVVKIARRDLDSEATACAQAAAEIDAEARRELGEEVTLERIRIDGHSAWVASDEVGGGEMPLRRVGGTWLVAVPSFVN
jgi:hypothetical protein